MDFADYGVPRTRKRLITIGKRTNQRFSSFTLHDKQPPVWFDVGREKDQITILQAITYLCKPKKNDLFRQIPTMNNDHAKWISNIPRYSGKSAFANNCSEKDCRHREKKTAIFCRKCSKPLPRPSMIDDDGKLRRYKVDLYIQTNVATQTNNTITMMSEFLPATITFITVKTEYLVKEIMVLPHFVISKITKDHTDYSWHGKYDFSSMKPDDYCCKKHNQTSTWRKYSPLACKNGKILRW